MLHLKGVNEPAQILLCCAMVQVVSHWPLMPEVQVQFRTSLCVIWGEQSDTATGFSPSTLVSPCQYQSIGIISATHSIIK